VCAFSFCTYTSTTACKFVFGKVSVNGLGFGKEKRNSPPPLFSLQATPKRGTYCRNTLAEIKKLTKFSIFFQVIRNRYHEEKRIIRSRLLQASLLILHVFQSHQEIEGHHRFIQISTYMVCTSLLKTEACQ
jgi:hypothetical protein